METVEKLSWRLLARWMFVRLASEVALSTQNGFENMTRGDCLRICARFCLPRKQLSCSDTSATPDSPASASLSEATLEDLFVVAGTNSSPTWPATVPTERIDSIWLRGVTRQRAWVSDGATSDHRMIVVEIQREQ